MVTNRQVMIELVPQLAARWKSNPGECINVFMLVTGREFASARQTLSLLAMGAQSRPWTSSIEGVRAVIERVPVTVSAVRGTRVIATLTPVDEDDRAPTGERQERMMYMKMMVCHARGNPISDWNKVSEQSIKNTLGFVDVYLSAPRFHQVLAERATTLFEKREIA